MNVKTYGGGTSGFLCLHGWNGDHRTFEPLSRSLPGDVSLYCPDIPTGESLSAITEQLAQFARTLSRPLVVVGNCSGALHALLLAEMVCVERIVMIDAFAFWPAYFRMFLAPGWGRYAYLTAFANPVGRWIANVSLARHRNESTNLTDGFARVDHNATWRALQLLSEIQSPERFRNIGCNIDIAYGERSFKAIRESATLWKQVFPAAREYMLRGAGHLPLLEATQLLRDIIFEENICCVPSTNSAR